MATSCRPHLQGLRVIQSTALRILCFNSGAAGDASRDTVGACWLFSSNHRAVDCCLKAFKKIGQSRSTAKITPAPTHFSNALQQQSSSSKGWHRVIKKPPLAAHRSHPQRCLQARLEQHLQVGMRAVFDRLGQLGLQMFKSRIHHGNLMAHGNLRGLERFDL